MFIKNFSENFLKQLQIISNILVKLFQSFLKLKKKKFLKVVMNQLKNAIISRKIQVVADIQNGEEFPKLNP